MESEQQQTTERETALQPWRSCKLIIDPALTNGLYKVYRYDGQCFNIPVQDLGVFPVDTVRDPRICRLWSKYDRTELLIPKFKIDECYVGPIPPKEVTFSRLNDNVREGFLTDMCKKYGYIDEVEIFYNPKNKKHLGIAKVIFDSVKAAKDTVQHLHQTSVMGNIIHVETDPKGENRMRYLQLLLSGLYTPWTLPVGSNEQTLQSLIDNLPDSNPIQRQGNVSSPTSIATPLSLDTAYSSIWHDTPFCFDLTPRSQGTPRTPCMSGTPLSQDSCYSSLQATPVLQGEPSTYSVHKPVRREICYRKPARYHGGARKSSDFSSIFKHFQPQPLLPLPTPMQTTGNSHHPTAVWGQDAQSSACNNTEPSFDVATPVQESREAVTTPSKALPLNCNSLSILSIDALAESQAAGSYPPDYHVCITKSSPSAVDASSGSPHPETESLDSRIEMLLRKSQRADTSYFDGKGLGGAHPQDSPTSPCLDKYSPASDYSLDCTPALSGSPTTSPQPTHNGLVDVSPTPLSDNEEDETVQAVASLLRNFQSPPSSHLTYIEGRANANQTLSESCPKGLHVPNEDKESSDNRLSGGLIPSKEISSLPQPPWFPSVNSTTQHLDSKSLPATTSRNSHPSVTPFPFPIPSIPPSHPPFPFRLPNGTIPFPPPVWIPPPGHHTSIPMPPPPIPPPPTLLGPPPPLIAPSSVAHPVHPYPLHIQPAEHLDKGNPARHGSTPISFCGPPWPSLPLPRFNPFVPPPGYLPVRENPHTVTVEMVLGVVVEELKSIIRKDITRRMVEGAAFKAFDEWWDCQEKKAKIAVVPLGRVEERTQPMNLLSHITGQRKKPQLPSFKVKRKGVHDPTTSEELENVLSSAHENYNLKTSALEVEQGADIARPTSEKGKPVGRNFTTLIRRHARPLELDSDVDEGEEEDNTLRDEEITLGQEENPVAVEDAPKVQCDIGDHDDDDEEEEVQKHFKDENIIISKTTDGLQFSDSETLSETSSSEDSEFASDFDSSDFSESTEDSSYSDLSSEEDEVTEEENKGDRSDECVIISSDEESMELEPPVTPTAPLTPGAQLELDLQDWSKGAHRDEPEEDQYTSCQHEPSVLDALMDFKSSEHQDHLQPPSPIGLPVVNFDVEMESREWRVESLGNIENLRPLTPTGSLVDSETDLLIRSKPTPPAVEEMERPHTPGQGVVAQLESEDSMDELLSLSPTSSEPVLSPSEPQASCPVYQDMPKTPGTEERSGWTPYSSGRVPATPGRETILSEGSTVMSPLLVRSLSNNVYTRTPQTPGRDIILTQRAAVHSRKAATASWGRNTVSPLLCDEFFRGSPVVASSPCSVSDSSAETPGGKDAWISSGVRMKPLQGLENMLGLLDEENRRETEKSLLRMEQWRWRKMRRRRRMRQWQRQRQRSLKRVTASLSSPSRRHRGRSLYEEMRILHGVWKDGLDEEDASLLQVTYERLQQQDNSFGWLSDTLWIPHPLTRVLTEKSEEHNSWQHNHKTGSARSEGFYKISRKDKMKYLNNTQVATEHPSTSTQQGKNMPAQPLTSSRAGSDFRAEQRRLLSSFSCDSDLVKFNQLKFRKKRIGFSRSQIHDWGLFAMEPISTDEMVIEYVGQTIRQVIADMREKRYEDEGIGSSYLFRVDQDTIIDATKCGNLARFINHSCNPNCYAKIITADSRKKIVIYSRQPININEEITYDYKFPIEDEKIPCLCGADSCRGSLN